MIRRPVSSGSKRCHPRNRDSFRECVEILGTPKANEPVFYWCVHTTSVDETETNTILRWAGAFLDDPLVTDRGGISSIRHWAERSIIPFVPCL